MWTSLGLVACFTVLLLIWWQITDEAKQPRKWTQQMGVFCITIVYLVTVWLRER